MFCLRQPVPVTVGRPPWSWNLSEGFSAIGMGPPGVSCWWLWSAAHSLAQSVARLAASRHSVASQLLCVATR